MKGHGSWDNGGDRKSCLLRSISGYATTATQPCGAYAPHNPYFYGLTIVSIFMVNAQPIPKPARRLGSYREEFAFACLQLNIRGRLILGFSVLCILLAGVVGTTIIKVRTVSESTDRTVNLRFPTAMTASDVVHAEKFGAGFSSGFQWSSNY